MTTFTIDTDNHITAHTTSEAAAATTRTPFDTFSTHPEFAELTKSWPAKRLVAIWNGLPGAPPIHKVQDRKAATSRIWDRREWLFLGQTPWRRTGQSARQRRRRCPERNCHELEFRSAQERRSRGSQVLFDRNPPCGIELDTEWRDRASLNGGDMSGGLARAAGHASDSVAEVPLRSLRWRE